MCRQLSLSCRKVQDERKDPETSLVILVIPSCRWSGFYIRHSQLPSYFPIRSDLSPLLHQQGRSGRPRKKKRIRRKKKRRTKEQASSSSRRREQGERSLRGTLVDFLTAGPAQALGSQTAVVARIAKVPSPSPVQSCGPRGLQRLQKPGEGQQDHDRTGQSAIANSHKAQATDRDALEGRWKKLHWH